MPLAFKNVLSLTNIGIQGLRVYFKAEGGTDWIDLGNVRNLQRTQNITEKDIKSSRNGNSGTVKILTSSVEKSFTVESLDVTDNDVLGLYAGSTPSTAVTLGDELVKLVPGAKLTGAVAILNPAGDATTKSRLTYHPKAQIGGDSEAGGDGDTESSLTFKVSILQDDAYKVPAAVVASTPNAPYGVLYVAAASTDPIAKLHAALETLAG